MPMTYEQVLKISKGDPEIAAFIMGLLIKNAELEARIKEIELRVKELKRQLKAFVTYLSVYQMLPVERIQQLLNDLTGYSPSKATILSCLDKLNDTFIPTEEIIREQLVKSEVLNTDETGVRVQGKLHWTHSVSNEYWTLYGAHEKGGTMDAMDILPNYHGPILIDY